MSDAIRIVAVAAGRGGTGKSTLSFALAHALRARGQDVALVDLDPQAGLTTMAGKGGVANPTAAEPVVVHGVTLYRGGRALSHATDAAIVRLLERAVKGGEDRLVIADMPPALHDRVHRLLFDRDDVFVIGAIKCEPASLPTTSELVAMLTRAGRPHVLVPTFTTTAKRKALNATALALRGNYPEHMAETSIPSDMKAAECPVDAMPATLYAPKSRYAQAVGELIDEVLAVAPAEG